MPTKIRFGSAAAFGLGRSSGVMTSAVALILAAGCSGEGGSPLSAPEPGSGPGTSLTTAAASEWLRPPARSLPTRSLQTKRQWFQKGRTTSGSIPPAQYRVEAALQAAAMPLATPSSAWTELGPHPLSVPQYWGVGAGRFVSLAADLVRDPTGNTVYAGAGTGGLWLSKNALGSSPTFTPLTDSLSSLSIGAIALDTSTNPTTIYLGTGEPFGPLTNSYFGVGVFKSKDGGQTWTQTTSANGGALSFLGMGISRITVDPTNPQIVLVAGTQTDINPQQVTPYTPGLYRSTDGGGTFSLVLQEPAPGGSITDLVYDATHSAYLAAVDSYGVFKSTDHGATWALTTTPFPSGTAPAEGNFDHTVFAARNGTVYALIAGNNFATGPAAPVPCNGSTSACDTGISYTTDAGQTWHAITAPADLSQQLTFDLAIAAPPNASNLVIAGYDVWSTTPNGLSTTWTQLTHAWSGLSYLGGNVHTDQHAILAVDASHFCIANDGGLWATSNAGSTWNDLNATLGTIQFYAVAPSQDTSGFVVGGAQDNGTDTSAASLTWSFLPSGGDGGDSLVNPTNSQQIFFEVNGINLLRSDNRGTGGYVTVVDGNLIHETGEFVKPMVLLPQSPTTMLFGVDSLWRGPTVPTSTDAGWTSISPSNTAGIIAIAASASSANVAYFTTEAGTIEQTLNLTATTPTWTNVAKAPVPFDPDNGYLSGVAIDPTNASTVYVTSRGFSNGHVFKSTNAGSTWTDISGNLPLTPANAIALDPTYPTHLYIGTDTGVYAATDGGAGGAQELWQKLGTGLPNASVSSLRVASATRLLVAGTYGRGAWSTPLLPGTAVQINCAGPAVSPFAADEDFSGGSTIDHANTIDLSGVTNPAPMAVYQSARVGNFTYTIPSFTAGSSHTVRLHFAETYFSTAGSRVFNVSLNGSTVLSNFDVYKAAGAKNKAIIEPFTANANTSGAYVIQFTSVVNNSLISGIEIQ